MSKTSKAGKSPIRMKLKTYVRRKLVTLSERPEKEARPYDTAITWAFVRAIT